MANNDVQGELEALRAEVAALSKARREGGAAKRKPRAPAPEPDAGAESPAEASAPDDSAGPEIDLKGHLEDLVEVLENEVKELPVVACLAIFVAGVVVGRMTR